MAFILARELSKETPFFDIHWIVTFVSERTPRVIIRHSLECFMGRYTRVDVPVQDISNRLLRVQHLQHLQGHSVLLPWVQRDLLLPESRFHFPTSYHCLSVLQQLLVAYKPPGKQSRRRQRRNAGGVRHGRCFVRNERSRCAHVFTCHGQTERH
jgi:hypothetical protein